MKKLKLLIYSLLLVLSSSLCNGQSWLWGGAGYGSNKTDDDGSSVATDKNGNAYITGQFETSINFDTISLDSSSDDAYLAKYDPSGNIIWAVQANDTAGAHGESWGTSVTVDKSGNAYICGTFWGTISFGTFILNTGSNSFWGSFLVKYSPSGNVIWALQSKGTLYYSYSSSQSVSVNDSNYLFLTGYFYDTLSFGSVLLNSPEAYGVFIIKLDSLGNVLWGKQSTSTPNYGWGEGTSVYSDNSGNAYIAGYFEDTINFGTIRLINDDEDAISAFVAKYSPLGSLLWAIQSNNESFDSYAHANSVITDISFKFFYIAGYFKDTVKFDSNTLYSADSVSAFIVKYDSGGKNIWAKQTSPGWYGSSLASDFHNHIYLGGECYNDNPDTLKYNGYALNTNPWDESASFLLKLDTAGNPLCGSIINNIYSGNYRVGVASDSSGNYVYMAGTFNDTAICGLDTLIPTGGDVDVFLGRWNGCNSIQGIQPILQPYSSVSLYPNPNTGKFTIQLSDVNSNSEIEVYNVLGEKVFAKSLNNNVDYNSVNMGQQSSGMYLYRIISEKGQLIGDGKFVIEN